MHPALFLLGAKVITLLLSPTFLARSLCKESFFLLTQTSLGRQISGVSCSQISNAFGFLFGAAPLSEVSCIHCHLSSLPCFSYLSDSPVSLSLRTLFSVRFLLYRYSGWAM